MQRDATIQLVTSTLQQVLTADGVVLEAPIDEGTRLVGGSVIDSLGLVDLILEVETRLRKEHGVTVTLADERAMSQRHSPFRTVGTLADYIVVLTSEG